MDGDEWTSSIKWNLIIVDEKRGCSWMKFILCDDGDASQYYCPWQENLNNILISNFLNAKKHY
jgi:hypothetical protein